VYDVLQPSSFYTQVYGDNHVLFTSPIFWFSFLLTVILAILPRYIYKVIAFSYSPTDIDILRWYVKANPKLVFDAEVLYRQQEPEAQADVEMAETPSPTRQSTRASRKEKKRRRPGPGTNPAAMGSQIDMATGVRSQSRGFGFSTEEGGLEMQRIQSHLSGASESQRRSRTSSLLRSIRRPLTLKRKPPPRHPSVVEEDMERLQADEQPEQ
jgi:phospholipid-translocating ATPase